MMNEEDKQFAAELGQELETILRENIEFYSVATSKAGLGIPMTIEEKAIVLIGATCLQIKLYFEEVINKEDPLDKDVLKDIEKQLKGIDFSGLLNKKKEEENE